MCVASREKWLICVRDTQSAGGSWSKTGDTLTLEPFIFFRCDLLTVSHADELCLRVGVRPATVCVSWWRWERSIGTSAIVRPDQIERGRTTWEVWEFYWTP